MAVLTRRKINSTSVRNKKPSVKWVLQLFIVLLGSLILGVNLLFSADNNIKNNDKNPLQPADPPAEDENQPLVKSETTIVTAYFQIRSKYPKETYMEWMSVMLSLQDPMIIFTSQDWVEPIRSLRRNQLNRTIIIVTNLDELPLALRGTDFWQKQLDMDPEKKRHASYQVFWIWLSKTYFVSQAIDLNPFDSKLFMWSDIGCFRGKQAGRYQDKVLIQHAEVVPKDRVLFLAHQPDISPPEELYWNQKLKQKEHFYHSGSQMVGYADVFKQYHDAFLKTVDGFVSRNMFIGDDQPVFQSTCLLYPHLCAYVKRQQVKDNHYFGLRFVVFHGGKFDFWYPPPLAAGGTGDSARTQA